MGKGRQDILGSAYARELMGQQEPRHREQLWGQDMQSRGAFPSRRLCVLCSLFEGTQPGTQAYQCFGLNTKPSELGSYRIH